MFPHSVHIAGVDDAYERSAGFRAELLFGVADDIEGEFVDVSAGIQDAFCETVDGFRPIGEEILCLQFYDS